MDPEVDKGITGCSDGFTINNPTSVTRHRTGNFETDGAKFGAGKHEVCVLDGPVHFPKTGRKINKEYGLNQLFETLVGLQDLL